MNFGQADRGLDMNKYTRILSKFRVNKRFSMIMLILMSFLLIIIGGFFWSQKVWSDYTILNNNYFDRAKIDINNSINQISEGPEANLSEKLSFIIQTQSKLKDDINKFCEVSVVIEWQNSVGQYLDKVNKCESQKDNLDYFLLKLKLITDYLTTEQELSKIISIANESTNQNNLPDKWGLIESFWRQASVDISKLSYTEQFNEIKELAIQKINNIADIWQQLVISDNAKDRQKFEEARTNLEKAYDSIIEVSDNSKLQIEKLTTELNISYEKLY